MKTFVTLAVTALLGAGALTSTAAQARNGGAIAAGVIGGLAAGALLGAVVSEAHAAPNFDDGYGRPAPVYGYGYEARPEVTYRPARVVRSYGYDDVPEYRPHRFVRTYEDVRSDDGYRHAGYSWHRHYERPYGGYRNW